jgi:serine/threonine-protein kinase RsbT
VTKLSEVQTTEVAVRSEEDLVNVRHLLRAAANEVGMGLVDQTKLVTAGSELTRNILTYARKGAGTVLIEKLRSGDRTGVRATFSDEGPGIEDVDAALTDGYSTAGGLGLGLPGARRLVDDLVVDSCKGGPTTVVIVKWRR